MIETQCRGKVLVADGDVLSRRFLQQVLSRAGYRVVSMVTEAEAKEEVKRHGLADLCCLLTDLQTPKTDTLDLLEWIVDRDPCVSAIVMSGSSDQTLFERTLRSGACNFLPKPLDRRATERAVREAAERTNRKRRTLAMRKEVEQVGLVQRLLINSNLGRESSGVSLCFHPKHEAGGDFFSFYELPGSKSVALLTDVSGHDLKSAFVAAYFQGMVRAMLEGGASLCAVFERCNLLLLNESASEVDGIPISIAACAAAVNRESKKIEVLTCGAPSAVFTSAKGDSQPLRTETSYPLGWFPNTEANSTEITLESGQITMWTDGVEEIADNLNASAAAVAFALTCAQQTRASVPWLDKANDDILIATLRFQATDGAEAEENLFYPLLNEMYRREQLADIDALQRYWSNSISLAMPNLSDSLLHDVLLCAREGMINALKHGCADGAEARLRLVIEPRGETLTLLIEDGGPGHDFDPDAYRAGRRAPGNAAQGIDPDEGSQHPFQERTARGQNQHGFRL
jgi:sigma-B regulation protein RsbU (phosphoserine phosphatase)